MRISTGTGPASAAGAPETAAAGRPVETSASEAVSGIAAIAANTGLPASGPASTPVAPALQSAVLQPALAAMRDMPDIDHAKVAAVRDALAKGEMPFDAAKLAGLIQRFHGADK